MTLLKSILNLDQLILNQQDVPHAQTHLRVLGLTLFEAHLTNESSRLVPQTLARREHLIRYVFKGQRAKPIS